MTRIESNKAAIQKRPYNTPKLQVHGDVNVITLGDDLGESVDAAFSTSGAMGNKNKKRKKDRFS